MRHTNQLDGENKKEDLEGENKNKRGQRHGNEASSTQTSAQSKCLKYIYVSQCVLRCTDLVANRRFGDRYKTTDQKSFIFGFERSQGSSLL